MARSAVILALNCFFSKKHSICLIGRYCNEIIYNNKISQQK